MENLKKIENVWDVKNDLIVYHVFIVLDQNIGVDK